MAETIALILDAVRSYDRFGKDYYWTIDYYDHDLAHHSPDRADPSVTIHVLTIMRVDEY